MHDEKIAPIALNELRGDSFLARSRRYFEAVLDLPLDEVDVKGQRDFLLGGQLGSISADT
jgi:hypothetical protein